MNQANAIESPVRLHTLETDVTEHPEARGAAVARLDDGAVVVAFVAGDGLSPRAVREWLQGHHPGHEPLDEVVPVAEIPMADGEPDWTALARVRRDRARRHSAYVAPRTGTERYLAALWEDLLGVERVGVDDDLFSLGGHSMLVVRIRRAIQRDHGTPIPPELLFENSVLKDQAIVVERAQTEVPPST